MRTSDTDQQRAYPAAGGAQSSEAGRPPKLNPDQIALAQQLYDAGERTVQQIADLLNVPRTTIYGHLNGKRPGLQRTPALV